jgi:hypothetical protein
MKTPFTQYTKVILLSLYLLQSNALFTSEKMLARHNKVANNFIQKLPHMTLPEAGNKLHNLQPLTQRIIWHKVGQNTFKNNNDILSTALMLTTIPLELQYLIFTEDFETSKTKRLTPRETEKASITEAPDTTRKKLINSSIYELFRWKAVIDKKCGKENFIKIKLIKFWDDTPDIILTKPELLNLTIDHINIIEKAQKTSLTKQQLRLFAELPDNLLEKLKPYYQNKYHQISFNCYEIPTLKSAIMQVLDPLVFTLPPLLYTYLYTKPAWNAITGTQDTLALEKSMKKFLHNKTVDTLQKNCAHGSEYLIKQVIKPVPFSYSWSDYFEYFKPVVPMSFINGILIAHAYNSTANYSPFTPKGYVPHKSSWIWRTINSLPKHTASETATAIMLACIPGFFSSFFTTCLTDLILNENDASEVISSAILYATTIFATINIFNLVKKPHWRYINFSEKKFANKSVKECINYYLNHPKIVIQN